MPWKTKYDDILQLDAFVAPIGKMFTYRGLKYPPTWNTWSSDYKTEMNLVWEDEAVTPSYDDRFYSGVDSDNQLIEKNLDDLKTLWLSDTKNSCNSQLQSTDWYVIRKADTGTAIPDNITKYRTDTRTACKTIEDKITACSSVDDFKKLFESSTSEVAPIYNFPKLEDY
jgi:hypothetical protein